MSAKPLPMLGPAQPTDSSSIASTIHTIFQYELTFPFLYPSCWIDPASIHASLTIHMQNQFLDPNIEIYKATLDEKITGFIAWNLGEGKTIQQKMGNRKTPEGSERFRKEVMQVAGKQFAEKLKEMGIHRYIELDNLGVRPLNQHHGVGTSLVQKCTERADERQLPTYVISTPSARDFYVKMGFEEIDFFDIALDEWGGKLRGWGMYRLYALVRPFVKEEGKGS